MIKPADFNSIISSLAAIKLPEGVSGKTQPMSGQTFYIGDGIIRWDNFFIALDHVEIVEKYRMRKETPAGTLLCIVFGGLLLTFSLFLLEMAKVFFEFLLLGGVLLVVGILLLRQNDEKPRPYILQIKLDSGNRFTILSLGEAFIDEVSATVAKCINDRGGYIMFLQTAALYNMPAVVPWQL